MDNELTEKMQVWLNAGPHTETEDIMDGALMLLRVNRNRVFYQNVMLQPQKLAATVEYEMRKVLKIRLDGQDEAMSKLYKRLYGFSYSAGQRVLVIKLSGTYIVLGRIV